MSLKLATSLILSVLIVTIVFQNMEVLQVNVLFWSFSVPVALLLFLVFIFGIGIGWLLKSSFIKAKKKRDVAAPAKVEK